MVKWLPGAYNVVATAFALPILLSPCQAWSMQRVRKHLAHAAACLHSTADDGPWPPCTWFAQASSDSDYLSLEASTWHVHW